MNHIWFNVLSHNHIVLMFRYLNLLGIDLENIVYYKDDTHYFVMTAKKQSLLEKGVIIQVRSHTWIHNRTTRYSHNQVQVKTPTRPRPVRIKAPTRPRPVRVETLTRSELIEKCLFFLHQDFADTELLLSRGNVDQNALQAYAREAADFCTNHQLPSLDFAMNHYGQPDVAMFDFTCMYASENAAMIRQRHGHQLLVTLVGDSLLEVRQVSAGGETDVCWG